MADITQIFAAAVDRHQSGDLAEAERLYRSILHKVPAHAPTLCNLGALCVRTEKLDEAAKCYSMCLAANPGYPDAHFNFGNLYRRVGRYRDAVAQYQDCLKGNPSHASAYFNMGLSLIALGELAAAAESFRQTVAIEPSYADAHNRLGDLMLRMGRVNDGIEHFRTYIALKPDDPRGYNNLGLAYTNAGKLNDALEILKKSLALNPNYPDANNTIALTYEALGQKDDAARHFREAVRLNPQFADAWSNLGTNLTEQGRVEEAILALRKSLEIRPQAAPIFSNYLLTLNYSSNLEPEAITAEHRAFAARFAPNTPQAPVTSDPDPERRLRIGYLSADFRQHTVAGFIELLLTHHNRDRFHVTAFANVPRPDDVTTRLQKLADRWRFINGLSDEQIAAMILADKIDILIDLSGHTAGNRLLALALRPAPIQALLFGYPNTTGLEAIDYRITDAISDPPGKTEQFSTEKLLRLEGLAWAYQPQTDVPTVAPLPSLNSSTFTFGCLNNAAKLSDACLATWVKLLQAIPNSRLILLAGQSTSGADRLRQVFTDAGIPADRLELLTRVPKREYFETYSRCDLALDPYPYNGGVTTVDALWMGVPVLTVAGTSYVSRQGVAILTHVGIPEFAADTPEHMIELAKIWAANREMLADIRLGLRSQVSRTIADGRLYISGLESALRGAWKSRHQQGNESVSGHSLP